jgi:hypothetical protein
MQNTVQVRPTSDAVRKNIRHPSGVGFNDNPKGTAWPKDAFTTRRIQDGDIEVVQDE